VSVTRTTVEETMHRLQDGDWEALSDIDQHSMVRIRNLRTGSRFTICIVDYRHVPEGKPPRVQEVRRPRP
jgi:hypothetical protein